MRTFILMTALLGVALSVSASDTTITYQGQLQDASGPVTNTPDMVFRLYNDPVADDQIGADIVEEAVPVTDGLFQVELDFGAVYDQPLWLAVEVDGIELLPRQPITAAPVAINALNVPDDTLAQLDCSNNQIARWNGSDWVCSQDQDTQYSAGSGLVLSGTTLSLDTGFTDGRYWRQGGNVGTDPAQDYLGTADAVALQMRVDDRRAWMIIPAAESEAAPSTLGGHELNVLSGDPVGAVVAGGGSAVISDAPFWLDDDTPYPNEVSGDWGVVGGGLGNTSDQAAVVAGGVGNRALGRASFIGGGLDNLADDLYGVVAGGNQNQAIGRWATVAGGYGNQATGRDSTVAGGELNQATDGQATVGGGRSNRAEARASTVAGGNGNRASADRAAVGGGAFNRATSEFAVIAGGRDNRAEGEAAMVPGGRRAEARGDYSLAAGYVARVNFDHHGAFVWSDSTAESLTDRVESPGADTFSVQAAGGIWLGTDRDPETPAGRFINTSTGGYLSTGGIWVDSSDRNRKTDLAAVDTAEILYGVVNLPLTTWRFLEQEASVRHLGPMAQDFHATFGLGQDDTTIASVDSVGVALAAIQGLHAELVEERERNDQVEARLADVEAENERLAGLADRNDELEQRLAALENLLLEDRAVASER